MERYKLSKEDCRHEYDTKIVNDVRVVDGSGEFFKSIIEYYSSDFGLYKDGPYLSNGETPQHHAKLSYESDSGRIRLIVDIRIHRDVYKDMATSEIDLLVLEYTNWATKKYEKLKLVYILFKTLLNSAPMTERIILDKTEVWREGMETMAKELDELKHNLRAKNG